MPRLLTGLIDQFSEFSSCAWRWQPGERYSGWEDPYVSQFAAGARPTPSEVGEWDDYLVRLCRYRDQGQVGIVYVEDDPPTDFQAWYAHTAQWSVSVGADVGRMSRSLADELGLPRYDFWLFDGWHLVIMLYSAARTFTGGILIERYDDPTLVDQHCVWRDLAIQHATQVTAGAAA